MSDRTRPVLWRFVKTKCSNSLGYSQYSIQTCDSDYVLSWDRDNRYDKQNKYVTVKRADEIATSNGGMKILWVLNRIRRSDGRDELYEILTAQNYLYSAQVFEHNEQLALLRRNTGFNNWESIWSRVWKIEPVIG